MREELANLRRDVRYAVRGLRAQPAFAVTGIVTIAVGTAALASVLSLAYAVLIRRLPYPAGDRLVQIEHVLNGVGRGEVSPADVLALREGCPSLARVTLAWFSQASIAGGQVPDRARQVLTDSHAFAMLGVPPLLGRLPTVADDEPGAGSVVIGHGLWTSRFGADPAAIGRVIRVDGEPHTIVAVMPRGFAFPAPYWAAGELWLFRGPSHPRWPASRDRIVLAFGLLREGRTLADAQQDAHAVAASLQERYPRAGPPIGLGVTRWAEVERAASRPRLLLLVGAAAIVFLIVCVNGTNLLLGRLVDRQRELATRVALGAGTARIVQQLATEAAVLFAAGGLLGLAAALAASRTIASAAAASIPGAADGALDAGVAATALGTTLAAAVIVGLVVAPHAVARPELRGPARGASSGRQWRRARQALVTLEIALAFVLLCGAGVLLDGAMSLARLSPGFDARGLFLARVALPPVKYADPREQAAFHRSVVERLRATPGVHAAAAVDVPPASGGAGGPLVLLEGDPVPSAPGDLRHADVRVISDGYFETLGLQPRAGRFFAVPDATSPVPVAVVNEAFVRRYLPGQPIGRRLRVTLRGTRQLDPIPRVIVGVVADLKEEALYRPAPPTIYVPIGQAPTIRMAFILRPGPGAPDAIGAVRAAVSSVDADLAAYGFMALEETIARELAFNRFTLQLIGALAAASLLLAVTGVYGVIAHAVRHRTREIGIRLALGLTPAGVRRQVIGEGVLLLIGGLACGALATSWTAGVVRSLVEGIDRTSPTTFIAAAILLTAAVLAGCDAPARRASRLDPARVLAAE